MPCTRISATLCRALRSMERWWRSIPNSGTVTSSRLSIDRRANLHANGTTWQRPIWRRSISELRSRHRRKTSSDISRCAGIDGQPFLHGEVAYRIQVVLFLIFGFRDSNGLRLERRNFGGDRRLPRTGGVGHVVFNPGTGEHCANLCKIVYGEKIDQYFAALLFLFDADASTQLFGELPLEKEQLRCEIHFTHPIRGYASGQLLRIAHRNPARNKLFEKRFLLLRSVGEHEKRPRVAFSDLSSAKCLLHILRQHQNAQRIRNIFAALADTLSYFAV